MRKTLHTLACFMLLQFIFINASFSQVNTPYWGEGFTTGAGCDLTTTNPSTAVSYYFSGSNSGSWWGKNLYSTTGTGCPTGNAHVRFRNIAGVTDSGALVTPVVNQGINEFHFYRARSSRGYTIYVTSDTAAQTTNWTYAYRINAAAITTCVDTTILIGSATAKRLKIVCSPGTDTDIDSVMLTSYSSATPTMYVQSATWSGSGTLDVNVKVSNFTNILDFQGTMSWNQAVLSYTGYNTVNPSIVLNNSNFNLTQTSSGKLPFIWVDPTTNGVSVANDATILVLHFTVLNGSVPNTTISFTNTPTPLGIDIMSGGNPTPVTNPVFTAGTITFPTITCTPNGSTINQTICSNQTYLFNGQNLNTAGTYLDTLVNIGGCDSLITLNLSVNTIPTVTIVGGANQSVNAGNSITLNGAGATSYTWNNGVTNGVSFIPTTTQSYTVTGTDNNNCSNTSQVTVTVIASNGTNLYVDSSIAISGNGNSWTTAFKHLTAALNVANSGTGNYIIHVAQGTYLPTTINGTTATSRDSSFAIFRKGISILGGYPAGGGLRNSKQYVTRISGDIGTVGVTTDNLYHVLVLAINSNTLDSLIIDGVNVEGGYGNGSGSTSINGVSFIQSTGGGVYVNNSSGSTINNVFINNCLIQNNTVTTDGGGMENYRCTLTMIGSCLNNNASGNYGGGLNNEAGGSLYLFNDVFTNNSNPGFGGGLRVSGSSTNQVINCTFTNNSGGTGGAIRVASLGTATVTLHNCIFRGNHSGSDYTSSSADVSNGATLFIDTSCLQSSQSCAGCLTPNTDPLFTNIANPLGADGFFGTADDGLTLTNSSPCVNTGNDGIAAVYGITSDIVGSPRNQGSHIDMGAYENGPIASVVTNGSFGTVYLCSGNQINYNSFNVSGSALLSNITVTPSTGFLISTSANSGYSNSPITLTQSGGVVTSTPIYVKLSTSLTSNTTGTINITSTNAVTQSLPISGIVGTSSNSNTSVINCSGSYTWAANNQTYTNSGTYYYISGCQQDTLVLTINQPTSSTTNHTSCSSYTWNGTTYTTSGTYTYTTTGSNNCDSVATLNLTINPVVVNLPTTSSFEAGAALSSSFTLSNGTPGYTWSTNSTLPTGVTFANGTLSGSPTVTGTFPIVVSVTDTLGCSGTSATYNLAITCPTGVGGSTGFFDGFESGNYTPTWSVGPHADTVRVTTTNPATGNYRLEIVGGDGTFGSHLGGLSTTISSATPTEMSWNIYPTTNVASNYVVIGDSNITPTNCLSFVYYINGGIRFVSNSIINLFPAAINQWHHVELKNINYTTRKFDVWIDGSLVYTDFPFRSNTLNNVTKVHLYNFSYSTGVWDDIRIGSQSVAPSGIATPSSQTVCSGGSITPIVLSGAPTGSTYSWTRDNASNLTGIVTSGSGNLSGSLTNTTLTPQTTTVTITPSYYGGCTGTPYTATVVVNPIVSSTTTVAACASYTWHNNTYTTSGNYADTLIGAGSTGCDSIAKLDLTINPLPTVFAGNDTAVCIGKSAVLHGSGANSYTWNYFVTNGVPFNPNITRVYTVTGTDGNGCVNTDSVLITVNSLPIVYAGADTTVCAGKSVVLHGGFSGNNTYTWNNGVTNNVAFVPTATQTYTVTGIDNRGCSATDQMTVTVNPLPNVDAGNDTTICSGSSVTLHATGANTYVWSTNNGVIITPIPGATNANYSSIGAYTIKYVVTGTDLNGCINTDSIVVSVNPLPTSSVDTVGLKSCFDANGNMFTLKGLSSAGNPAWSVISNPNALNITWYTGQNIDSPIIKILGGTGGNVAFRYRVTSNQTPNCGISEKMLTVRVIPIPTVNSLSNLSICNGTSIAAATFTSPQDSASNPVTYTWSNIAPPTGLNGQNVAGNLPSYTATNTSDILVYDAIKVKPTISLNNLVCHGNETLVRTVEVKPLPRAVLNNPQDTIQCNGSSVTLNVQAFVANQFNWTTTGDNVGLGNTIGLNQIPTFTATNVGNTSHTGNFVITPAAVNGCAGVPLSFNVTVKPTPHITNLPSVDSICSGTSFSFNPTTNISGTSITWKRVGPNSINDTALGSNSILQTLSTNNALDYKTAQYNFHLIAAGCANDTAIRVVVKPVPSTPTFTLPNDFCHNTAYINLQADRAPFANEHFIWSTNPDSALFQNEQRAMIKFALGQNIIHLKSEITGSGCQTGTFTDTFNNTPTPFADPYIIKKEYVVNGALNHIVLVCLHNPVQNYHWGRTRASDLREDNLVYAAEKGQELYFKNPNDFNTDSFYYWVKIVTDTEYNCFRQIYYNGPFASKNDDVIVSTYTPTGMKVYPNPAQTNVTIELTGNVEDNYQIKVLDVIGQSVYSFDMNDKKQQVDIQALPSGYYLISCWHKGVQIATSKLIKN